MVKNKQHDLSVLRHRLSEKAEAGVEEVKWKLRDEEKEFLEWQGYNVRPWLYCIVTRELVNVSKCDSKLLKEIHYGRRKGRKMIFKPLTEKQIRIIEQYDIHYSVCKYIVRTKRS